MENERRQCGMERKVKHWREGNRQGEVHENGDDEERGSGWWTAEKFTGYTSRICMIPTFTVCRLKNATTTLNQSCYSWGVVPQLIHGPSQTPRLYKPKQKPGILLWRFLRRSVYVEDSTLSPLSRRMDLSCISLANHEERFENKGWKNAGWLFSVNINTFCALGS